MSFRTIYRIRTKGVGALAFGAWEGWARPSPVEGYAFTALSVGTVKGIPDLELREGEFEVLQSAVEFDGPADARHVELGYVFERALPTAEDA